MDFFRTLLLSVLVMVAIGVLIYLGIVLVCIIAITGALLIRTAFAVIISSVEFLYERAVTKLGNRNKK